MTKLNRKTEYALMALKYMSSKPSGQLTSAKEVCEATGGPFDALARVMQVMAQKGLLKSEQGSHGGYCISRNLSKVSFYDFIEMVLGPLGVAKCIQTSATCELMSQCNIQSPVAVLNRKLKEFYEALSLQELLEPKASYLNTDREKNINVRSC